MAPVGFLNQALYTTPALQASFRDITVGATDMFAATPGWDVPTGWGTPNALGFAQTFPSP
jgi:kumamolisin